MATRRGGGDDGDPTAAQHGLVPVTDHPGAGGVPGDRRLLPANRAHRSRIRRPAVSPDPRVPVDAPVHAWRPREPRPSAGRTASARGALTMDTPAYGLWLLVILNSAVFLIFAFSFTRPKRLRDWRSFGAFSAFVVALFT